MFTNCPHCETTSFTAADASVPPQLHNLPIGSCSKWWPSFQILVIVGGGCSLQGRDRRLYSAPSYAVLNTFREDQARRYMGHSGIIEQMELRYYCPPVSRFV